MKITKHKLRRIIQEVIRIAKRSLIQEQEADQNIVTIDVDDNVMTHYKDRLRAIEKFMNDRIGAITGDGPGAKIMRAAASATVSGTLGAGNILTVESDSQANRVISVFDDAFSKLGVNIYDLPVPK